MKKIVRLTESQLINMIEKIVSEQIGPMQELTLKVDTMTLQKIKQLGQSGTFTASGTKVTFNGKTTLNIPGMKNLTSGKWSINGTNLKFTK